MPDKKDHKTLFTPDQLKRVRQAVRSMIEDMIPMQTAWVEVTEVDWANKLMDAEAIGDELPYFSILLSLDGSEADVRRPKVGTKALIALVENQEAAGYMLDCQAYEERIITLENGFKLHFKDDGTMTMNGDSYKGLVKVEPSVDKINVLEDSLNELKNILTAWAPVAQDGGLALKNAITTWAGQTIQKTVVADLENDKIKHGG